MSSLKGRRGGGGDGGSGGKNDDAKCAQKAQSSDYKKMQTNFYFMRVKLVKS